MKMAVVCSPGGHLTQAVNVLPAFSGWDYFLILQRFPSVADVKIEGVEKIYKIRTFFRYSRWFGATLSLCWSIFVLFYIFIKEKPQIIFSTGAEIALPAFWIGKIFFGARLVFLESLTRTAVASQTGKMVYGLSDVFFVQHPDLAPVYGPKAVYAGSLL